MTQNKKFGLILVFLTILPNILVWISPVLENKSTGLYINDYKQWFLWLVNISILGPILILYLNNRGKQRNKSWNVFAIVFGIVLLMYILAINSLANIGF